MARQYQSHERLGQSKYTSSQRTTSSTSAYSARSASSTNTYAHKGASSGNSASHTRKKHKKEKVFSLGFTFTSLMIGIIVFLVFLSIGILVGPNFPI